MTPGSHRPNILLVMDDQHRFDWLGCAGAHWLRTPNIDRLAQRGVHLTHCCTNAPICAPARISLATGLLPRRTGMVDNNGFLRRDMPTYYRQLRDGGYRVGCVGKLHMVNNTEPQSPTGDRPILYSWGFTHPEEHEGKCEAPLTAHPGIYSDYLQKKDLYQVLRKDYQERRRIGWPFANEDSPLPCADYHDYWIGTRAVRWLEQIAADRPWHLFVSFGGPHDPFDPPAEYARRYRDAQMPPVIEDSLEGKPPSHLARRKDVSPETRLRSQRQYAALIEMIDEQVGRFLAVLERRGMLDNTIVIFTSDHGEMLGDHGMWRKFIFYEQALRVPLVMAGPGIEPRQPGDALIELSDLNPTICELAGVRPLDNIDAQSFLPLLRGDGHEHRETIVSQYGPRQCLRTRTHKIVQFHGEAELYDLVADPHELRNLAARDPATFRALQQQLEQRHFSLT